MTNAQTTWLAAHDIHHTSAFGCEFFAKGEFYIEITARGQIAIHRDACDPMLISAHSTLRDALAALIAL